MVWRIVLRKTAEITSAAPPTPRSSRATHSQWTSPKPVIAAPHIPTARITALPWRRTDVTQPVVNAPTSAPAPGAADRSP